MPYYKDVVNVGTSCGQKLWLDQAGLRLDSSAVLNATNPALSSFSIMVVNSQCYKCKPILLIDTSVEAAGECSFLWTPHSWFFDLYDGTGKKIIDNSQQTFGEHGQYTIKLTGSSSGSSSDIGIDVIETLKPNDTLAPIYTWLSIFAALIIFFSFVWPRLVVWFRANVFASTFEKKDTKRDGVNSRSPLLDPEQIEEQKKASDTGSAAAANINANVPVKPKSSRLDSLDTFRGIALCFMMFVNYGGGGYWFFDHAPWNGLTFADLLFPWFMWIMGVSMALSYSNRDVMNITNQTIYDSRNTYNYYSSSESILMTCLRELAGYVKLSLFSLPEDVNSTSLPPVKKTPRSLYVDLIWHSIRRSVILFALGMFLANGYEIKTWRVPGVLQYFAVSNLLVTMTVLFHLPSTNEEIQRLQAKKEGTSSANESSNKDNTNSISSLLCSGPSFLGAYRYEWIAQGAILTLYIAVALGAKAPGCPRGYEGPGGIANNGDYPDCTGGIHRWIDMQLFGYDLIYHYPTCMGLYQCQAFDPEGALGSLSAVTLTYLGLMSGRVLVHYKGHLERLARWAVGSFVLLLLAGILCGFSQNEGIFPVNKNLWSTSFVFVTSGFALIMLSVTYVLVDIMKVWSGAPFRYLGLNSILIYMAHELFYDHFPFAYLTDLSNHSKYLQMTIIGVACWFLVAYYCYTIKFFVKI